MKINVNGKPFEWNKDTITYREVVELSGQKYDENIVMSITFHAKSKEPYTYHEGILSPGKSIPVWENTLFGCYFTGNA